MPYPDQVHDHKHSEYENNFTEIYCHEGIMCSIGGKLGTFGGRFNTWIIYGENKKKVCANNPQFVYGILCVYVDMT